MYGTYGIVLSIETVDSVLLYGDSLGHQGFVKQIIMVISMNMNAGIMLPGYKTM